MSEVKDKDYYDNGEYEDDYDYVVCVSGKDEGIKKVIKIGNGTLVVVYDDKTGLISVDSGDLGDINCDVGGCINANVMGGINGDVFVGVNGNIRGSVNKSIFGRVNGDVASGVVGVVGDDDMWDVDIDNIEGLKGSVEGNVEGSVEGSLYGNLLGKLT